MNRRRQFLKLSAAGVVAGIIGSYPIFIERHLVQVNRYRIPVPRLPRQFDGFTIVQLTDLHYGPLVSRSFLEEIIGKANSLRKDAIVPRRGTSYAEKGDAYAEKGDAGTKTTCFSG